MKEMKMKNEIIVCVSNEHPIYTDNFKCHYIKVGKAYKCTDELLLTTENYYIPEFASLSGVTIKSHIGKWGWSRPCFPKSCFRIATKRETKRYKCILLLNTPIRVIKICFFKAVRKIDYVIRRNNYKKIEEQYMLMTNEEKKP